MVRRVILTLAVAAVAGACGSEPEEQPREPVPPRVVGLIVDLEMEGGAVRSFVLEAEGERYDVLIDQEIDYGFDLQHLREHQRLDQPVDVKLEQRGGALYATEILDA